MESHTKCKIIALSVSLLVLLVACNQVVSNEPPAVNDTTPDTSTFELAPDLIINPALDGLVNIRVEFLDDTLILKEIVTNHFESTIRLGHPSDVNINLGFPALEYFDGENWRVVPENGKPYIVLDIWHHVDPGDEWKISSGLNHYHLPKSGLFRWRRRIIPIEGDKNYQETAIHDLVGEFSLGN